MFTPPCGSGHNLSWGYEALRGHWLHSLGRLLVSVRPRTTFVALRALSCFAFLPAEAGRRPSMYFRSPSEDIPQKPRIATTRSPGHKGRLREPRRVLPLVDFYYPTTHTSAANRVHASGSLRRHTPRARFGYLLRDSFTAPANTTSRVGAPMGFTLQGFPLERDRSTFRWPYPLDVAAYTTLPPERRKAGTWPPSGFRSRVESVQHRGAPSTSLGLPVLSIPS